MSDRVDSDARRNALAARPPHTPQSPPVPVSAARANAQRQTTASRAIAAARRCSGCTRSGAARRAASRPTAAAGDGPPWTSSRSQIRADSQEFVDNRERMLALVGELRDRVARAREGGGAKYVERHRQHGKLPVRERIAQLIDANTPFLELSALAAWDMYDNEAPAAGIVTGIARVSRPRGHGRRQRRDGEGRHLLPDHRQEAPARAADRAREPAALRVPRRFRRRVPAASGRGVSRSRALRPHLLQPGPDVGRAHSADCRRHGLVHGRRRLRAGDVGRDHHRQGHRHDFPWRPAARESRHRRGSDGRRARRRRRAHAPLRRRRLLRRRRRARDADGADDRLDAAHGQAPAGAT